MHYLIGDFSKITRLSIKTLRFYHEYGILKPAAVDNGSGYRYYSEASVATASIIVQLKALGFSLKEIRDILDNYSDDGQLVDYLKCRLSALTHKIRREQETRRILEVAIQMAEQDVSRTMLNDSRP